MGANSACPLQTAQWQPCSYYSNNLIAGDVLSDNRNEINARRTGGGSGLLAVPAIWIVLLFLVAGTFMSALIPPFQSPDEFEHVKRAYFLSHGTILLDAPEGQQSGGYIDGGLGAYIGVYANLPSARDRRLSIEKSDAALDIQWNGQKEYTPAPGSAVYFPLVYLPQALGLAIGERTGMSVDASYRLARLFVLFAVAGVLVLALRLFPTNPLLLAMLVLPMSLFQFSSATLDAFSNALAIFCISAFLRLSVDREKAAAWIFYVFALCIAILISCRVHLLPMLLLLLLSCRYVTHKRKWLIFALTTVFIFGWIILAMKTTVDHRASLGASTGSIVAYYVKHPWSYFKVLVATLSSSDLQRFYRESFLGILGWLDTPFRTGVYVFLTWMFGLIAVLSISVKTLRLSMRPRMALAICAGVSVLLIFFALLVSWTPHPASIINGVQGRYFWVPVAMLAYAISGEAALNEGWQRKLALLLVFVVGLYSMSETARSLISRYYMGIQETELISLPIHPSPALSADQEITIQFDEKQKSIPQSLKRIGIMFGTYARDNPGSAGLVLTAVDGRVLTVPFQLVTLQDNKYHFFTLDPLPYHLARIVSTGGAGVSTWEGHHADGRVTTCIVYEFVNGTKRYTPGCARF